MRAVFIGPPGSGKGTQARLLQERLGLTVIGTGDILREAVSQATPLGRKVQPFLDAGQLAPDDLVNAVVAERFSRADRPEKFILDGYPRNAVQADAIDAVLKKLKLGLTAVVHFRIDDEVVAHRLLARQRSDDDKETVLHRLRVYRDTSRELVNHYRKQGILHEVQADDLVEHLYVTIAYLLLTANH